MTKISSMGRGSSADPALKCTLCCLNSLAVDREVPQPYAPGLGDPNSVD